MIMSSSNALQPASGCAWRSERDTRRPGVTGHARGQSIVELAMILTVLPPTGTTVPSGLALTCTLYQNAVPVPTPQPCPAAGATWSHPTAVATYTYTATVMQVNGLTSAPSTPVSGP